MTETTAQVFADYLGLNYMKDDWAYTAKGGMVTPTTFVLTATSPLAPEPTPGWRERMEEHKAFIALERLCAPRMYRATCLVCGNGADQGETVKFDEPHPTHAVARALVAADPTLRARLEACRDWEGVK